MSKVKYTPTFNRLLLTPIEKVQSGLILVQNEDLVEGRVETVGEMSGWRDGVHHTHFSEGQIVKYSKSKAIEIELDGVKYHLIIDENIILIRR